MRDGMGNCGCGEMQGCGCGRRMGGCCGSDDMERCGHTGMHRGMSGMHGMHFMGMGIAPSNKHMAEKLKYYKEDLEEEIKLIEKRIEELENDEKGDEEKD